MLRHVFDGEPFAGTADQVRLDCIYGLILAKVAREIRITPKNAPTGAVDENQRRPGAGRLYRHN